MTSNIPIVALGASAGGLQSLKIFFDNLPSDTGLGFVVIVHLDASQESNLPDILSRHTKMPVAHIKDSSTIKANHVFVASPGQVVRLSNTKLHTENAARTNPPTVIDELFRSVAIEKQHLAIGIVFSGFGSDGTQGIKAIHAHGGLCFAENSESAQYSDMPNAAMATGCVDSEASASELAKKISEIASIITVIDTNEPSTARKNTLSRIFAVLANRCHIHFEHYKDTTIQRRLQRRVMLKKLSSLEAYLAFLSNHPEEQDSLCDDLLIKVTEFFRDKGSFDALCKNVFPEMINNDTSKTPIRIWVAGCATGEEAYSLTICWLEFIQSQNADISLQIFATDVSEKAIDVARHGIYSKEIEKVVSKERLQNYFTEITGGYQVSKRIRDLCVFAVHNLIQDPPFSQLDLISCRNTLIYFSAPLQKKLIPLFHYALKPNGYLWFGDSESCGNFNDLFQLESKDAKIYKKKNTRSYNRSAFDLSYLPSPMAPITAAERSDIVDEDKIRRQADRLITNDLGPAGWVVDKDFRIIHIVGRTAPYISPRTGTPSHHLSKTVCNELQMPIRQGIEEIKQNNLPITKDGIIVKYNGDKKTVQIKIQPIRMPSSSAPYFLITIHETMSLFREMAEEVGTTTEQTDPTQRENQCLRQELDDLRFQVQNAFENQEASNEELRATNEELLSSNEELRSTNEELQTAKEEMQSTNEELGTLNDELHNRNEDLGLLSDDMENFIRSTDTPIIMLDSKLCIRRFTPATKELFNLISTDTARPLSDLKANFELPDLDNLILKVIDTLQMVERDIQLTNGNWYLLRIRPYKSIDNKIEGATLSFTDITERKRGEDWTKTSEEMFRDIVETIREPLMILDSDFIVKNANASFFRVFEVSKESTIGSKLWSLGNGQWDIPKLRALLMGILPKSKVFNDYDVEHTFEKIGRKIMRLNARRLDHKELILLAIEDVTESRAFNDRIQISERNFRFLFEHAPVGIAMVDCYDKFIGVNNALCSLLGFTEKELLGLTHLDVSFEGDRERSMELQADLFKGKITNYELEKRFIRKDGSMIWTKLAASVIKNSEIEVERSIVFIEDITSQMQTSQSHEQAKVLAESASQAKTDFLASMSHEIRTPLSAISGFSELLADRMRVTDDEELLGFVQRIRTNSAHLKDLIEDLLDLSRIEAGKINVEMKNFPLLNLLAEIEGVLSKQAESKGISFDIHSDGKVPTRIYSDPLRLRQILINIIGNAIKFTDNGGVTVTVSFASDTSQLCFAVKDTGIGIAKEQQGNLFQRFSQADSSVVRRFGGTGLGLILSKRLATALGGDVILSHSLPGEGSEFVVTVSGSLVGDSQTKPFRMEELKSHEIKSKRMISQTLRGMRILLVEDSEDIRVLMEHALRAVGGAEVDFAENGKIAVEKGGMGEYDLILMDTMMPVMGGYEATEKLREMGIKTPIVALSARTLKSEIEKGLAAGCEEYLTKPVEMNKLISVVRKYKMNQKLE